MFEPRFDHEDYKRCHVSESGAIVTPQGRMQFCALADRFKDKKKAATRKDDKGEFSTTLVIAPSADMSILKKAVEDCAAAKYPKGVPPKFNWPIRYCKEVADKEGHKRFDADMDNWFHIRALTYMKRPGILLPDGKRIDKADQMELPDELVERLREVCYAGRWARISVTPACYDNETRGVKFWLNNVQLLSQDDRIGGGGGADPETDFGAPKAADGSVAQTTASLFN